jgi:hypothetical protein
MGGRITTYTNTAGRGQDVGECLVPPRIGNNSAAPPVQQTTPSSAQAPIQLPQQGDVGPAPQPPSPRVAALPPEPPRQASGASQPPVATAAPASAPYKLMIPQDAKVDPDSEYCRTTPELDRTSALYGMLCIPDTPAQAAERADRNAAHYAEKSPVNPNDLAQRAEAACPLGAQMDLRQQHRCIESFKLNYLLANEPAVQAECSVVANLPTGISQAECVNAAYLYGPGASRDQRRMLAASLHAGQLPEWIEALTEWHPEPKPLEPVDGCPLGLGLKPDRSAFGAWTCQPLGDYGTSQASNAAVAPGNDAVAPEEIEQRINRVAEQVIAAVAARAGKQLSADDLKTCMDAAFAAARGLLKGGFPKVSPQCRELTNAAMAEITYYQRTGVPLLDPQNETLLAVLSGTNANSSGSLGGNLRPPPPGMTGLEPSAEERRQMDCVARGGTREDCLKAPTAAAPPPPRTSQAPPAPADCTLAAKHWDSAEKMNSADAYQDHLDRFPSCPFATLAKLRIEALNKKP